jgi:ribosomal protein L21
VASAVLVLLSSAPAAQTPPAPDAVTVKGGKVFAAAGREMTPLTNSLALNPEITVLTNATFTVGSGTARPLAEGQMLSNDGRLMSPNGKLELVYDHVTTELGQVIVVRDGKRSPVNAPLTLPGGTVVQPDGWVTPSGGKRSRLLDGQVLRLDGKQSETEDTITLRRGEVVVQKDGARLTVARSSTMVMSDGTKVYGNGRVVYRDGREEKLTEGQIIVVEGAASNRR